MKLIATFIMAVLVIASTAWADPLNESLIYNVYFGTAADVQRLLRKGADPNATDEHQWPALAIASDRNDAESTPIAQALIEAGADVNNAHNLNYSLINAIRNNNVPLVELLLSHEASIRVYDARGQSPYAIAKKEGNEEILYYLEKIIFEERQLKSYLQSAVHLRQIMEKFTFNNCAFQYWSFYLNSKQDKNIDEAAMKKRIQGHANKAQEAGREGLRFFPTIFQNPLSKMTTQTRLAIYNELNGMLSNRNRRVHGVGKEADMQQRCQAITDQSLHHYGLKR